MRPELLAELLKVTWCLLPERDFTTTDGREVRVIHPGEYDETCDHFIGAEAMINGITYRGEIVITAGRNPMASHCEHCILQVVPCPSSLICKQDGRPLPQIIADSGALCQRIYEEICSGDRTACIEEVKRYTELERLNFFSRMIVDRLHAKQTDVETIFRECQENWNDTAYVMLLRTIDMTYNKEAFTELARRVKYKDIAREMGSPLNVEALLLGTSGLLERYPDDEYTVRTKNTYDYLRRKYSLTPMRPDLWKVDMRPPSNPVIRIAQLAALLSSREFLLNRVIECRTLEDVQTLFKVDASNYWTTHFIPGVESSVSNVKRLSSGRANLMGINYIVPMLFTYGKYQCNEEMSLRAFDFLEKLSREENSVVDSWRNRGVPIENAFGSQAILQLNKIYCRNGLCWQCPVGRRIIKRAYTMGKSE